MSKKPLRVLFTLTLKCALVCFVCSVLTHAQTTIHVPADQPTIQSAIIAAQPGDTVLVAPGTYIENLDFLGKAITVTSSDGPAVTIVDGNAVGPVVTFQTGETASAVLNGFTLQNGVPSQAFGAFGTRGGGMLIVLSSPTITNNVITRNHAICGVGVEIRSGSPLIRNNTISGNTQAFGDGGCGGGGIEVTGDSSHPPAAPLITGNTITNNSLLGGGNGGGIAAGFFGSPTIQNNYIAGNAVANSGGGVFLQGSPSPVVVQNIIVNNSVGSNGSGAGIALLSAAAVVNNTIAGNTAFDGSSGIFENGFSPMTISNNIVVASAGQNGIVCSPSAPFPNFSHNDVTLTGTGGQTWSSNCASFGSSNGNISADPLFANTANGDYHLQGGSPAIDAGDDSAPNLAQEDYDGNPRITFGNATTCTNTVDIGAYEFVLTSAPAATLSPAALDFDNVTVGTSSNPQTVTFAATQGCVSQPVITVSGDFHETDNCTSVLGTGASCTIQVTFSPTAAGTRAGVLTVTGNQSGNPSTLSLSGTGANPATASVSPLTINFGSQVVGTDSALQAVIVSNTGNTTLHVNSLIMSGDADFFTSSNNCVAGTGIAPGGSCTIQMEFAPRTAGPGSATLTIGSDASNGPVSVALSGTGVSPATASVSPSAVNFGSQAVGTQSPAQSIAVTDSGTGPLHITSLAINGDADFSILGSNCPIGGGISPGATCFIDVAFAPRSLGPGVATLTITSDASNNPVSVPFSGTGVNPPKASVSPTSLSFGSLLPGTESAPQTITVSNIGGATLHINNLAVTGDADFFTLANNCVGGTGVAPGGSCSIQVVFFPHSGGPGSATLTITSNDPAAPQQSVSVTGTGIDYAVSAPSSFSVRSGSRVQTTVTVSAIGGSFSNSVALSCSGLPTGASCSFSPGSVVPGASSASSSLAINTQQSGGIKTPVGTYTITVNGTSSSSVHSASMVLTVTK